MSGYNSRTADKFVVRLGDGLRDRIQAISKDKHRSMNGQILQWLELCMQLEENNTIGINPDELKALLIEAAADPQGAIVMSVPHANYTPAPGTPVRIKNGGVWIVRNYTARDGVAVAILECFTKDNQPALLDVGIDQLEPA